MRKNILAILFFGICLIGCKESDLSLDDQNYPTTINLIPPDKLAQLRNDFFQKNPFISSTLNDFGFCTHGSNIDIDNPPNSGIITQEKAIIIVKNFIANNRKETGITSINNIHFDIIQKINSDSNNNISSHWYLSIPNQIIDSLEVLTTGIGFRIINGKIVHCANNWFPEVYIPKEFEFSSEKAKTSLINQVFVITPGITGTFEVTITLEDINESNAKLMIRPITKDDTLKLRVVWEIMIPNLYGFLVYIDVMSGEIISTE